jgi:hypothetical protein
VQGVLCMYVGGGGKGALGMGVDGGVFVFE